jgi:hypothetical protein
MNVRDLGIKFNSYAHSIASREWARDYSLIPALICVAPDIVQERRMLCVAQDRLVQATGFELWTTTEVLLNEHGPLARIWLQGIQQRSKAVLPSSSLRQSLLDIIHGLKSM